MTAGRARVAEGEVAEWVARYRAGESLEGLSRRTGRDRRVLRRVLAEAGVRLRTRRTLPGGQLGWVIEQYQAGATLRELAAGTGCSASAIRGRLIRAGVPLRRRGTRPASPHPHPHPLGSEHYARPEAETEAQAGVSLR